MYQSNEQKGNELINLCKKDINEFRREYETLDSFEKSCVIKNFSLLAPCQIEIFWVSDPTEFQLVMVFHDPEREDQEVIVNGPYHGYELENEIIKLMGEPRWKKEVQHRKSEEDSPLRELDFDAGNQENKYSDLFVNSLDHFLRILRLNPTAKFEEGFLESRPFGDVGWYQIIKGNLASSYMTDLKLSDMIESARQNAVLRKNLKNDNKPSLIKKKKEKKFVRFAGAYYYPGLYIGDSFEQSFKEKLHGPNIWEYPKYEHEFSFGRKKGYFDKYGLVILQCNSVPDSLKKLNIIFAISLLKGFPVLSVRNTELIHSKIYDDNEALGQPLEGLGWYISHTKRFTPSNFQRQRKTGIPLEQMYEIVNDFGKVIKNDTLSDYLLSLIESHTHLYNKEYSQSYLFSWMIVEQDIANKFGEIVNIKIMSKDRKGKLKSSKSWSSESKIEFLNLYGSLSDEEYDQLIKCNNKRNNFVHNGSQIDEELAESLYNLSFRIVEKELIKEKTRID